MTPKISIIIPVYHVEEYIIQCLQSVANQTMTEGIECIVVDDCGGDRSIEIAQDFVSEYKGTIDFKIIYREYNGGLSAARNSGIDAATGEYLYFLDSDDEITNDCMELMYGLIQKHGKVDLVQGSFYETEEEKKTVSKYNLQEYDNNRKHIKVFLLRFEGDIVGAQSRLIRKDFLLQHNLLFKEGIIHEDNYWTFFLAKYVSSMCFCPKRTYYHRYNPTSITGNVNIQKESVAYKTIVESFSNNIDRYLPGAQKELTLNNLIVALNNHYYASGETKQSMIQSFLNCNTKVESLLLLIYMKVPHGALKSKILHLLIRLYKFRD